MTKPLPRLITIPFSHFCEKGRWSLEHAGLDFTEEPHLPGASVFAARRAGGKRTTPALVLPDGSCLTQSTAILEHADSHCPAERRLLSANDSERAAALDWVARFDKSLGPHSRRLAYGYLLKERDLVAPLMRRDAPPRERWMAGIGFPVTRMVIRKALRIDPAAVERSREKVDAEFDAVEQALGAADPEDARLVGERFGAADLTFAALAAPVLFPTETNARMFPFDELTEPFRGIVEAYRQRPAGRFALSIYRRYRQT